MGLRADRDRRGLLPWLVYFRGDHSPPEYDCDRCRGTAPPGLGLSKGRTPASNLSAHPPRLTARPAVLAHFYPLSAEGLPAAGGWNQAVQLLPADPPATDADPG